MGAAVNALGHVPAHPNALKIHVALDQNANRNPLEFLRLLHALSGTNPHSITPILTGLTHHAVNLHLYPPSSPLHQLTRAALKLDLHAISPTDKTPNPAFQPFVNFLTNLISAHADYIEPVFQMIVKRAFTMSAARESLLSAMNGVVFSALHTHPRARSVLLSTVQCSYPHPVRPPVEHLSFARATLRLARERSLECSLLVTMFERVAAIEALVPHNVFATGSTSQLGTEAERLEVVLLELCAFFEHGGSVEAALSAYQMFIVPMDAVRYTPYALLFGASVTSDANALHDIVERLWQCFHDPRTPARLRERFLEHAGWIVLRAKRYSSQLVVRWVCRLAGWLNAYIDAARGQDVVVDVDIHLSFYTAVGVLLRVMTRRCEAFRDEHVVSNIRLYRIISSGMNAFVVLPRALVEAFVETMMQRCGVDYRDVVVESEGVFPASRTVYGSKNEFVWRSVCADIELERLRARVGAHVLWDHDDEKGGKGEDG